MGKILRNEDVTTTSRHLLLVEHRGKIDNRQPRIRVGVKICAAAPEGVSPPEVPPKTEMCDYVSRRDPTLRCYRSFHVPAKLEIKTMFSRNELSQRLNLGWVCERQRLK